MLQASSHQSSSVVHPVCEIEYDGGSQLMQKFFSPGWAIPIRQNVRFSFKERVRLYNEFIDGEKSGNKVTPDKVVNTMRKTNQYKSEFVE